MDFLRQLSSLTIRMTLNDENSPQYANTYRNRNLATLAWTQKSLKPRGEILLNPNFVISHHSATRRTRARIRRCPSRPHRLRRRRPPASRVRRASRSSTAASWWVAMISLWRSMRLQWLSRGLVSILNLLTFELHHIFKLPHSLSPVFYEHVWNNMTQELIGMWKTWDKLGTAKKTCQPHCNQVTSL